MKLPASIVVAIIGAVAAITGAYFTAASTSEAQVSDINTKVEVLKNTQSLQYTEVKGLLDTESKQLTSIDNKLDKVLLTK